MPERHSQLTRKLSERPVFVAAALLGAAVLAAGALHCLRSKNHRPERKSRSRGPNIRRGHRDVGDGPQVFPIRSRMKH